MPVELSIDTIRLWSATNFGLRPHMVFELTDGKEMRYPRLRGEDACEPSLFLVFYFWLPVER
jgi:hypothetical protein